MTDDEVMDAVNAVLDYITALDPMAEVLVESGVTLPLGATGAALLLTAVTGEILRDRALSAYNALCVLTTAPDAGGLGPDAALLAAAREIVREAVEHGVMGPADGGDGP